MKKFFVFVVVLILAVFLFSVFYSKGLQEYAGCPFCDKEVINYQKFYEDDLVIGLYSYKPIVEGHCLLIPKRDVQTFDLLTDEEAFHLFSLIKRTHAAAKKVYDAESYLLLQKNGQSVGQSVPHVHIHFIPRKKEAGLIPFLLRFVINPLKAPISKEEMLKQTTNLKNAFEEDSLAV